VISSSKKSRRLIVIGFELQICSRGGKTSMEEENPEDTSETRHFKGF
jgi:hypothetical protein